MQQGDQISADEILVRRIYRHDKRYIDKKTGRPTSRAFVPRPKDNGKLSVDIKRLTSFYCAIDDQTKYLLFSILSKLVYDLGLSCIYKPLEGNLAHALIVGFDPEDESVPGILARASKKEAEDF